MPSQKAVFFFAVFYDKNRPRRAGQPLEPQEQAPAVLTVTVNCHIDIFLIVLASNHINAFAFFIRKYLIFIDFHLRAEKLFFGINPYSASK